MADVVQRVNEIRRAIDAVATGPVDVMAVTRRHTPDEINPLAESEIIRIKAKIACRSSWKSAIS